MRKIILDTETTGIDPKQGHRLVEIGAIELQGRTITQRTFHVYLNPEREVEAEAEAVHGLSYERLKKEPKFAEVVEKFLAFIDGAELIIHNAPFDMGFLNAELARLGRPALTNAVTDTLKVAREMHPGKKNSLDALCARYEIDNSQRTFHGALLDSELLAEVYLAFTRGQHSLLEEPANEDPNLRRQLDPNRKPLRIVQPDETELAAHTAQLNAIAKESKGKCLWHILVPPETEDVTQTT